MTDHAIALISDVGRLARGTAGASQRLHACEEELIVVITSVCGSPVIPSSVELTALKSSGKRSTAPA